MSKCYECGETMECGCTGRIAELEAENERLRGQLQTAWNMSDLEFAEAQLEELPKEKAS